MGSFMGNKEDGCKGSCTSIINGIGELGGQQESFMHGHFRAGHNIASCSGWDGFQLHLGVQAADVGNAGIQFVFNDK
eukprot:4645329-Ditylum_brightwellii.AAC.1